MGSKRTIIVNGNYIARQDVGVQILHADKVYTNKPDEEQQTSEKQASSGSKTVEDVAFEEVSTHFSFITDKCVKNGMVEHVESHLCAACKGTAEALWKTIHSFEFMGYLDTLERDSTKIYNALSKHFGTLPFGVTNFRKYR